MTTDATEETTTVSTARAEYPLQCRVEIHSLVKAPDLNDEVGVVETPLKNGRQVVFVETLNKRVALKPTNLRYEPRPIDSLSAKELKARLEEQGHRSVFLDLDPETGIRSNQLRLARVRYQEQE